MDKLEDTMEYNLTPGKFKITCLECKGEATLLLENQSDLDDSEDPECEFQLTFCCKNEKCGNFEPYKIAEPQDDYEVDLEEEISGVLGN